MERSTFFKDNLHRVNGAVTPLELFFGPRFKKVSADCSDFWESVEKVGLFMRVFDDIKHHLVIPVTMETIVPCLKIYVIFPEIGRASCRERV